MIMPAFMATAVMFEFLVMLAHREAKEKLR